MTTPQGWEKIEPAFQACADNNPQTFIQYCPCLCATEAVIYICNSNHITDDNFDVFLNGSNIGSISLIANSETTCTDQDAPGGWWSTDPDVIPQNIGNSTTDCFGNNLPSDPLWDCCVDGLVTFTLTKSLLTEGANTIHMQNTNDNGFGNFGRVGVFKVASSGYICEHVVDEYYSAGHGQSFDINFNWTWQTNCATTGLRQRSLFVKKNNKIYVDSQYLSSLKKFKKNNKKIIETQKACKMQALYEGKTQEESKKFKLELINYAEQLKANGISSFRINYLLEKKIVDSKRFDIKKHQIKPLQEDCNCRRKIKLN